MTIRATDAHRTGGDVHRTDFSCCQPAYPDKDPENTLRTATMHELPGILGGMLGSFLSAPSPVSGATAGLTGHCDAAVLIASPPARQPASPPARQPASPPAIRLVWALWWRRKYQPPRSRTEHSCGATSSAGCRSGCPVSGRRHLPFLTKASTRL